MSTTLSTYHRTIFNYNYLIQRKINAINCRQLKNIGKYYPQKMNVCSLLPTVTHYGLSGSKDQSQKEL